jgi:hypothetical protein
VGTGNSRIVAPLAGGKKTEGCGPVEIGVFSALVAIKLSGKVVE